MLVTESKRRGKFGRHLPGLKVSKDPAISDRTLAGLRLLLSISALLIILIDPNEPSRLRNPTYFALIAYVLYSLAIYGLAKAQRTFSFRVMQHITWVDVLWYSAFITLNAGTNAVFFFFYFFAIIAGSSRGGTRLGLMLTFVCTGVFLLLNVLFISELQLEGARFLRRTVYLGALGCILAYWGGAEAAQSKKLTFLKELSQVANPRLGVDRTILRTLKRVLDYYSADYCFMVIVGAESRLDFYRATTRSTDAESQPMKVDPGGEIPLMSSSDTTVAVFSDWAWFRKGRPSYRAFDANTQESAEIPMETASDTAELLGVRSFVTAPLRYRERIRGRILVGSERQNHFDIEDATFLQQAGDQVLPLIENIRLVDRLASDAAEEERRKIARCVHDRVIQPYLGLQIGLKALQQELSRTARAGASAEDRGATILGDLVAMTRDGIDELREYVSGLRNSRVADAKLVDSIRRFSDKFESATGIHVDVVDNSCGLTMNDRLSAEVFQMTAEALSNVHRHTQSRNALVTLALAENTLKLQVENDVIEQYPRSFRPLSIIERAEALGARTEILMPTGKTLVRVEVPL